MNFRNPKFNRIGTIDCEVEHPEYGWIPFTASPDDSEARGRALYAEFMALGAGGVAPVTPPSTEEVGAEMRALREGLMIIFEKVISNPLRWETLTRAEVVAARAYRQALLDVPQQAGFPHEIIWPEPPAFLT